MGMSDQYDDGRYDSGYTELPGGWRIPNSQAPEPFKFGVQRVVLHNWNLDDPGYAMDPGLRTLLEEPITVQRGGIKYPTPTKETHMPEPRMSKAQIEKELRLNAELQDSLRRSRLFLIQQAKTAIPAEPVGHTMFSIAVKYKMRGKQYQFLILRNGPTYFTTGTKNEQKVFPSWEALVNWLDGPDVYSHSDLEILASSGKALSFTSGAIERMDPTDMEPPF